VGRRVGMGRSGISARAAITVTLAGLALLAVGQTQGLLGLQPWLSPWPEI